MKFTFSWLKEHIKSDLSLNQILELLVKLGFEVESISDNKEIFDKFLVAEIVGCVPHPNNEELNIYYIDYGSNNLIPSVNKNSNLYLGMKCALGLPGTMIPKTGRIIENKKIDDVYSYGLILSYEDLLLKDRTDILELPETAIIGEKLNNIFDLNDPLITLSVPANRNDCLGIRGIARDLVALGSGTLNDLNYKANSSNFIPSMNIDVYDNSLCPYFIIRVIKNLKNLKSPLWMKNRLELIGIKSVNALVDITNYITIDLCQPLHIFDKNKINGDLKIRLSNQEEFIALNGKKYILDDRSIVLSDTSDQILSLCGIIGGMNSSVSYSTKDIVIESAIFDSFRILNTSRYLNIKTESSIRFEKGIDPESVINGIELATSYILDICGGELSDLIILGKKPTKNVLVPLRQKKLQSISGTDLNLNDGSKLLESLGFKKNYCDYEMTEFLVPSWRFDIEIEEDLIEEILRIKGYDYINELPLFKEKDFNGNDNNKITTSSDFYEIKKPIFILKIPILDIKKLLTFRGLYEVIGWSFVSRKIGNYFNQNKKKEDILKISNPISNEFIIMRPSILASFISIISYNQSYKIKNLNFFEIGFQYEFDNNQRLVIGGFRSGNLDWNWAEKKRYVDIFDVKGDVLEVFNFIGFDLVNKTNLVRNAPDYYHPNKSGSFVYKDKTLAFFGDIHPHIVSEFNLSYPTVAFEIFYDVLEDTITEKYENKEFHISYFPSVIRDFCFTIPKEIPSEDVLKAIKLADTDLITSVKIIDSYNELKNQIGKKSLNFQVTLESCKNTLTEEEINKISKKIIENVFKKSGGILRQM